MKKTLLSLVFLSFTVFSFAQEKADYFRPDFNLSIGVNGVQDTGSREPFTEFDEWNFNIPISVGVEYNFARNWSIEQSINFNQYKDVLFDGKVKDYTYWGTDTNFRYYFNNLIKSDVFDLFLNAGVGVFDIDDLDTSANFGGGFMFWFSDSFGFRLKALGKWALDNSARTLESNHFLYTAEFVVKL